jgi:hypothetical protein
MRACEMGSSSSRILEACAHPKGICVPAIAIETNKDSINLERHLKWNLNYVPNKLIIIIGNLNRKNTCFRPTREQNKQK